MQQIDHLIILVMENRSFDHYLGALTLEGRGDVEGLPSPLPANPTRRGRLVAAKSLDVVPPGYADPPHDWGAMHEKWNNGTNDGFVRSYQRKHPGDGYLRVPMGFYTRKTLPVYYQLAAQFTVCDRWFASILSSTWPNRKYLHSGRRDSNRDTGIVPLPPAGFKTTPIYDFLEDQSDPDVPGRTLTWKYYFTDLPFLGFWYQFAAAHTRNFAPVTEFARDSREDSLPNVSIVDPPFTIADDHPSHDPRLGQKFVGLVVDALTASESWSKSALVVLYDESGGFFDHVPPPAGLDGTPDEDTPLGFRVPAFVVSPYARRRYACHTVFDHTAVMKAISERWSVPFDDRFGARWKKSRSIWTECFDFSQPPLPAGTYTGDPILDLNWGTGIHRVMAAELSPSTEVMGRPFMLPELQPLDNRARVFETLSRFEQDVIALKRSTDRMP